MVGGDGVPACRTRCLWELPPALAVQLKRAKAKAELQEDPAGNPAAPERCWWAAEAPAFLKSVSPQVVHRRVRRGRGSARWPVFAPAPALGAHLAPAAPPLGAVSGTGGPEGTEEGTALMCSTAWPVPAACGARGEPGAQRREAAGAGSAAVGFAA